MDHGDSSSQTPKMTREEARTELDSIFRELVATREALDRATTPEEKAELEEKLIELKGRMTELPHHGFSALSDEELQWRIEGVRHQLDQIFKRKMDPSFETYALPVRDYNALAYFQVDEIVDRDAHKTELEHELKLLEEELERRRAARSKG